LSGMDPADCACFGTFEEGHPECEACPFKDKCVEKAGGGN
jgi:hypothetical protein